MLQGFFEPPEKGWSDANKSQAKKHPATKNQDASTPSSHVCCVMAFIAKSLYLWDSSTACTIGWCSVGDLLPVGDPSIDLFITGACLCFPLKKHSLKLNIEIRWSQIKPGISHNFKGQTIFFKASGIILETCMRHMYRTIRLCSFAYLHPHKEHPHCLVEL